MKPTGAVFFREGEGIDAKRLIAKVCDGGRVTNDDARKVAVNGIAGPEVAALDLVAFAVHAPRNGYWAMVDNVSGALGISKGEWSTVALAANHLHTDAIWYRTYAIDLALAVYFRRGSRWMRAYAGVADDVLSRLEADGMPVHESQPPATAVDALIATVAYEPGRYTSGPDAAVARQLLELHEALVAGDVAAMQLSFSTIPEDTRPLALAIVRGADRGNWRACIAASASQLVAKPPQLRVALGTLTLDEELLRRACEISTADDFEPALDHLDAIESDAAARSSHSHPAGVAALTGLFSTRGEHERSLACVLRLMRRAKPAWNECNHALSTLLKRQPFALDTHAHEAIRLVEARLPELGQSAIDAITYNLACVFSRAGELERALAALRRCTTPLEQNAHPEQDTDLEPLWRHPEFLQLIAPPPPPPPPEPVVERPEYVPPAEYAAPRFEIELVDQPDAASTLCDRLGGKPNAPTADFPWPSSSSRPMDLILQVRGKAGGGDVDLGDIHVLQIFADLEGEFYEPGEHAVVVHRAPCTAIVEPPATVTVADTRVMILKPGADDRRLLDDEDFENDDARRHSWCDKIGGVPVGGNLDTDLRDENDEPMRFILELMTYDDYFLWALFAKQDLSVFQLEIVRG